MFRDAENGAGQIKTWPVLQLPKRKRMLLFRFDVFQPPDPAACMQAVARLFDAAQKISDRLEDDIRTSLLPIQNRSGSQPACPDA
jgi:hypothetical protein